MASFYFDKAELGNLQYSLQRELLATNRAGGYMSTTIVGCNTRKYHGLMVSSLDELGGEDFVLLSSLDETIIQHKSEFNLAIHRYRDNYYEPRGHKYIVDFVYTPTPTTTYRVGGVVLKKELLWVHSSHQLLIKYTLVEATSQTFLRLRPLLAFRSRHELSKENMEADTKSYPVSNGVKSKMYDGFPFLFMQTSNNAEFVAAPHWYNNFVYGEEIKRGYEAEEDLLTTGFFECEMKKGESVIFSASTSEVNAKELEDLFNDEIARRSEKTEFLPALRHSARQFLITYQGNKMLTAGYHWYNPRSRETFMALAGCTITQGLDDVFEQVLGHHVRRLKNGFFGTHIAVDTSLWFFRTLQALPYLYEKKDIWHKYKDAMCEILEAYRSGNTPGGIIKMMDNGLIFADMDNVPLTWMRAMVEGKPVTRRPGFAVEVNALWYNAVCFALNLAIAAGDTEFVDRWKELPEIIQNSFVDTFYLADKKYLADYVYYDHVSTTIRPNQLLAVSLAYSPLNYEQKGAVLECVKNNLFTLKGVRTLSPGNPEYVGMCKGSHNDREHAMCQGTAFPWLLEHYVVAGFEVHGEGFISKAEEILEAFQDDMLTYGVGSVPEIFDGDPSHAPAGAISYAPSVGALLVIQAIVERRKK